MENERNMESNLQKALEKEGIYTSNQLNQVIKKMDHINIGCMVSEMPQKVESKV